MQYRQWVKEYESAQPMIPTVRRDRPSSGLIRFEDYLKENNLKLRGPILDLGCGNGRNTFYFATKGYKVYALDFIPSVLNRIAEAKHPNVKVVKHSLPRRLPFKSASIGLVLDFITTASLNTAELKQTRSEIYRVLRPGGFFLTYCLSDKNSYHAALKRTPHQKFVAMPNGIRDRIWNPSGLLRFYNNLTPQFVYIRHKNEQVGDWFGPLEMVLALFRK